MLALIVSSAGVRPQLPSEFWDSTAVREGWTALRHNRVAKQQLTPILNRLTLPGAADFLQAEQVPVDAYPTVESFESAVWDAVDELFDVNPRLAAEQLSYARNALNHMRRGLDRKSRAFFATPLGKRALLERELRPVVGTLIVVPTPLLEHWAEQLRRHVDLGTLSRSGRRRWHHGPYGAEDAAGGARDDAHGRGAVYIDGAGDLADIPIPFPSVQLASAPMASAAELSSYMVVVTTFERCRKEHERADVRNAAAWQGRSAASWSADDSRRSPLMALRWLRLVVDEGHALGGAHGHDLVDEQANAFVSTAAVKQRRILPWPPVVLHGRLMHLHDPFHAPSR